MLRRVERNADFTVSGTDRSRVAQGQIEIHRQSNVLDYQVNLALRNHAPDHIFNLVEHPLRVLDACANRGTNVEAELAGVYLWEKIFAKKWRYENERENHDRHHNPHHTRGGVRTHFHPAAEKVRQFSDP